MRTDPGGPPGGSRTRGPKPVTDSDFQRWLRLTHLIERGPILRLYCATRPMAPPGGQPYPPHPLYPDGTDGLPAADLVHESGGAVRELVGNRPDHRERPLDHLTELVIRPLVVVLRELVNDRGDRGGSGGGLFVLDPAGVAFEVSPYRRLTGRVVVADAAEVGGSAAEARPAVARSVRRFAEYLDAVALGFCRAGFDARVDAVRGRVAEVVRAELRFLPGETADLLRQDTPWAGFVHTVEAGQDRVLRSVLRAVAEQARRRRADPASRAPLVTVDTALAGGPGLGRFARDVGDAGGELALGPSKVDASNGRPVVARFTAAGSAVEMEITGGTAERIATFETLPRRRPPAGVHAVPALSHTRSLEELQLAELRTNRPLHEYIVLMPAQQSIELVNQLVARADLAADRTADAAALALRSSRGTSLGLAPGSVPGRAAGCAAGSAPGSVPGDDRATAALVRHLLTRKQFIKGARSNYPIEQAYTDMLESVRNRDPIPCAMMGFPLKQCENGLKALGRLPDLAELGALVRLRELHNAIRNVYPPGIRLTVLTDGRHFRPRSAAVIEPYQRKLAEYAKLTGCDDFVHFVDVDDRAADTLAIDPLDREWRIEHRERLLHAAFAGLDITLDPPETLRRAGLIYPGLEGFPTGPRLPRSVFPELFTSIAFSAPVDFPPGMDRMTWAKTVYDSLYDVGPRVAPEVLAARRAVLRHSWDATIRYASTLRVDAELGYDRLFAGSVWLKAGAPQAGTCGFCFLGGSGLLPWHGTGAVGARGEVSTDFAVSLFDQAFVKVFSPLLGGSQPFMMVPVTATHVAAGQHGARLDSGFLDRIRLRRR